MSKFKFDFDAIKGKTYDEGLMLLFKQMEDHYNANVNVKPSFVFGADPAQPGADTSVVQFSDGSHGIEIPFTPKEKSTDLIRITADYEIKTGESLGLKAGFILTGVTDTGVEIFDYLKNYVPGDTVLEGESGKYDIGGANGNTKKM